MWEGKEVVGRSSGFSFGILFEFWRCEFVGRWGDSLFGRRCTGKTCWGEGFGSVIEEVLLARGVACLQQVNYIRSCCFYVRDLGNGSCLIESR